MQMPTRNRNKKKKEKRKSSPLPSRALTAGRAEPRTWPGRSCTCPALSSGRPPPAGAPSSPSPGRRRGWRSGSPSAGARPATAWQPCCSFCALPSTCRPAQGTQGDTNELLDVNGLGGMCSTCSPVGFAGSLPILFQCPTEARRGQALRGQQLQACRAQLHPGSAEACRYFYTTSPHPPENEFLQGKPKRYSSGTTHLTAMLTYLAHPPTCAMTPNWLLKQ